VKRFLTELISSDQMLLDLIDEEGRVAAAVLIDRIHNPSNDASLEILGIRAGEEPTGIFLHFLERAAKIVPKDRSGFQATAHESLLIPESEWAKRGLIHAYDTYEMRRPHLRLPVEAPINEISRARAEDRLEIFQTLRESFAKNPETSIPEERIWLENFQDSELSHYYIVREDGLVAGFAHLVLDGGGKDAEIRNLGVRPRFRHRGFGRDLLAHGLREAARLGAEKAHLSVAVENENALKLYLDSGFQTADRFKTYRFTRPRLG
jgi:ribosomal protein S18 acetylase RimI-like enzyme